MTEDLAYDADYDEPVVKRRCRFQNDRKQSRSCRGSIHSLELRRLTQAGLIGDMSLLQPVRYQRKGASKRKRKTFHSDPKRDETCHNSQQSNRATSFDLSRSLVHYFNMYDQLENKNDYPSHEPKTSPRVMLSRKKARIDPTNVMSTSTIKPYCYPEGKTFVIDEVLCFSTNARALVEASSPHHVVHVNAVYCQQFPLKPLSLEAIEFEDLESVKVELFHGQDIQVYPVWGSEGAVISHYLLERDVEPSEQRPRRLVG